MVSLFMLMARMEELDATLPEEERYEDILEDHRKRMLNIAQVFAEKTLDTS